VGRHGRSLDAAFYKPDNGLGGLVLLVLGHRVGWPLPRGGSQTIANALAGYFVSLGGQIQTDTPVRSLGQLPSSHAILLDITPRQVLAIAGQRLSPYTAGS
jgi:phytoene dehydrogenase-like protein